MANTTVTPSPCGVNASLDEAKAAIDELKSKISEGLNAIGDLGSIADTIKEKLSEVNVPQIENFNLQAELAKLPYLSPTEYNAAVEKIKNFFGKTVENLDEIIEKIPKPVGLSTSTSSLFQQLQDLAAGITTTTQDILDSLSEENIAAAITDLCKEVPNIEAKLPPYKVEIILDENGFPVIEDGQIKIVVTGAEKDEEGNPVTPDGEKVVVLTDTSGNPVLDGQGEPIATTIPEEKAAPPITPQKNPKPEVKPSPPPVGGFTFSFTKDKFVAAAGPAAAAWYDAAAEMLPKYGITTPERVAGWIGQIRVETGFSSDPKKLQENLLYSSKGLLNTFRKYFKTLEDAIPFERKPEKIANKVYANRYLNGDEASGDGYRYRGRGLKQLTFKANYLACSKDLYGDDRLVKNPDVVATDKKIAIETSLWFWKRNNLSGFADKQDYRTLSIKVNGGTNGLVDRLKFTEQALNVLKA
jgi:putative chitinase